MMVLPKRKCGRVKCGLYAVSEASENGTLEPWTWLAYPFPAEIANPRKAEPISMGDTLDMRAGLWPPTPYPVKPYGLPAVGVADLWGRSAGYKDAWDVAHECSFKGTARRIAQVPDVPLPYPVLALHKEAMLVSPLGWGVVQDWLLGHDLVWSPMGDGVDWTVDDTPWVGAESLGRVGDETYHGHPYTGLMRVMPELRRRRLRSQFVRECQIEFEEAVFGMTWITAIVWVLGEEESAVPKELAKKGVLPAMGEGDPRAK